MELNKDFFTYPESWELEFTVIGTGGGYGESSVIKSGNQWIVIDSCINPKTKDVLPLSYLKRIGADLNKVGFVICTHWHNDHILGLSEILKKCPNAKFVVPRVNNKEKFIQFITIDSEKALKGGVSSTTEFEKCLKICIEMDLKVIRASSNQIIGKVEFTSGNDDLGHVSLNSLSPSESVVAHFDKEIGALLDKKFSIVSVPEKSANEKSVVILVQHEKFSVLLGADLEVRDKEDEGWKDIINNCLLFNTKPAIYKIPVTVHPSTKGGR